MVVTESVDKYLNKIIKKEGLDSKIKCLNKMNKNTFLIKGENKGCKIYWKKNGRCSLNKRKKIKKENKKFK